MKAIRSMKKWTKTFPKKAGWYWFYGHRFKGKRDFNGELRVKELCSVEARKANEGFMYVCNGSFMFEKETGKGKFISAILPEIEKEIK